MAQPLMQTLQVTAAGRDIGELHLRIHPTNNAFTVATCLETTTLHLVQLKELVHRKTSYPVAAYIGPPPAAVCGVTSQAFWKETLEQVLKDFQTRNPDADITTAHTMGRTLFILITFAHGPVPHIIRYMGVVYRCTEYKLLSLYCGTSPECSPYGEAHATLSYIPFGCPADPPLQRQPAISSWENGKVLLSSGNPALQLAAMTRAADVIAARGMTV
ncbi:hypothetical protein HPB51_018625 [Rhipicephalus microplus]|uniref:Uncharacterized protein n=1 Tax=Rhipicephalus microplus TaxID=6941 RepID=A0A9J6F5Q3_RHIMP|nr:hypothetical protein HPB51_018625 [Rhipicephalus microplus]